MSATSPRCWFSILASVTEISKTGFKSSGHIDLVEEISRQSDIRSVARLLLAALSQVYSVSQGKSRQHDVRNNSLVLTMYSLTYMYSKLQTNQMQTKGSEISTINKSKTICTGEMERFLVGKIHPLMPPGYKNTNAFERLSFERMPEKREQPGCLAGNREEFFYLQQQSPMRPLQPQSNAA